MDEDADLRAALAELGPDALASLWRVLQAPEDQGNEVLWRLMAEGAIGSGQLIASAMSNEVLRLRILRAIRDLDV